MTREEKEKVKREEEDDGGKQRRADPSWFSEQMASMKERCVFCKKGGRQGKSKCWKHNWECCKFCAMGEGHCEKHDQHGRWKPDMTEIMSGRWEKKLEKEAKASKERKEQKGVWVWKEDGWDW